MFDLVLNYQFLSGAASALTIIVFIYGIFSFFAKKSQRLFYQIEREIIVPKSIPSTVEVTVRSERGEGQALVRDRVLIINKSGHSLDDADFVGLPFVINKSDGVVYSGALVALNDSGSCSIAVNEHSVKLSGISLPTDTGLALEICHDGCIEKRLVSTPKSLGRIKPYKYLPFWDRPLVPMLLGFPAIVGAVMIAFPGFDAFEQWLHSELHDVLRLPALFGGLLISSVGMAGVGAFIEIAILRFFRKQKIEEQFHYWSK